MKKDEIVQYLGYIVDVEKNIYSLNSLIDELNERKDRLGIPQVSSWSETSLPMKPKLKKNEDWILPLFMGIVCFVIPWFVGWVWLCIVGCLFGIVLFIMSFNSLSENFRTRKDNKKQIDNYKNQIDRYYKYLSEHMEKKLKDEERLNKEQIEIASINKWIEKLNVQKRESQKHLDELYSHNIIYPKYRNIVAVCSFFDYFSAGLCYAFEAPENGVGGAYYIFENEMLHKQIIMELQDVNENLNQIKTSQYSLYCAIIDSKEMLSDLNSSMQKIVDENQQGNRKLDHLIEESKISNYYAKQMQKELSYINNMQYLSGEYDSVNPIFRTPPT